MCSLNLYDTGVGGTMCWEKSNIWFVEKNSFFKRRAPKVPCKKNIKCSGKKIKSLNVYPIRSICLNINLSENFLLCLDQHSTEIGLSSLADKHTEWMTKWGYINTDVFLFGKAQLHNWCFTFFAYWSGQFKLYRVYNKY